MSFSATSRESGDVTIIDISGQITYGEAAAFHAMLQDLLGKGRKKFLLNLDNVNQLDSSGVAELVGSYTTIRRNGGEMKMLHLNVQVQRLLAITNLCKLLEDYSDEQAALRSFL